MAVIESRLILSCFFHRNVIHHQFRLLLTGLNFDDHLLALGWCYWNQASLNEQCHAKMTE